MDNGETNPTIRFKDNKFVYPWCWILRSSTYWRFNVSNSQLLPSDCT